jgi:hypothetical protein
MILIIVLTAFAISFAIAFFTSLKPGNYYSPGTVVKYKTGRECGVIDEIKWRNGKWVAKMKGYPGWISTNQLIKP